MASVWEKIDAAKAECAQLKIEPHEVVDVEVHAASTRVDVELTEEAFDRLWPNMDADESVDCEAVTFWSDKEDDWGT